MTTADLTRRLDELCAEVMLLTCTPTAREQIERARARLHEPLRVALAGRVKAGKSTLLNAIVGERLAPTDAGECTRIVTWYRQGAGYQVEAHLRNGAVQPVEFRRTDGKLDIDLGGLAPGEVARLEVSWPSSRLAAMTLIDTPGLEGTDPTTGDRTRELFGLTDESESDVDAIVYLMRHMHARDAGFLEAFADQSVSEPSPVNSLAVLSRADELGSGRPDALTAAARIADRYAADDRVRTLCATVVPVAGLIAETGVTFREDEAALLRTLATLSNDELDALLLSADRFASLDAGPVPADQRRSLIARLGMFGVRFCLQAVREGRAASAQDLSRALVQASGVPRLARLLDDHFGRRAHVLKARSALATLKGLAAGSATESEQTSLSMLAAIERVEVGAHEFAELRIVHALLRGTVQLSDAERHEVMRLVSDGDAWTRLGLAEGADVETIRGRALGRIEYWRERAADPLGSGALREAAETIVRSYEGIAAGLP